MYSGKFQPAISAMDKLAVDESLPLSNQATFSLFFDLGAFAVSVVGPECQTATQRLETVTEGTV